MVGGSQQLRQFRIAIRDGATLEEACAATGNIIEPAEGKMHLEADRKSPPGPECFELLYDPATRKEPEMAEETENDGEGAVEVKAHDYELAMKIVKNDILPANSKSGEYAQEASTAYKAIKKQCHMQAGSVKDAIKIADKEEAKRDDYLRGLANMVNLLTGQNLLTFNSHDLVDRAEAKEDLLAAATAPKKEPEVENAAVH